jgi:hypothetical protein
MEGSIYMRCLRFLSCFIALAACCLQSIYAWGPPWKLSKNDGVNTLSVGFLAQPQFESLENTSGDGNANSLFLRRIRFLAGGNLGSRFSFFIESDNPCLGKTAADGKRINDFFLQDAYVSYAFRKEFHLDGGMILVPLSHNSGQSATSLLAIDYGPYSFMSSDPTRSKLGRDYGLQARGYIKNHFEYRVGVFRGNRNHDGDFPYRYTARFVWYPLEADTGFFYTGTTHGRRKIIGIGASIDRQGNYGANSVDFFLDHPLNNGDAITLQADFIHYDGGRSFKTLPKQNDWLVEGSYYFGRVKLGPFVQYASKDVSSPTSPDDKKIQGGVAYWLQRHRTNIKAGYGKSLKDNAHDRVQFIIQAQFFYY